MLDQIRSQIMMHLSVSNACIPRHKQLKIGIISLMNIRNICWSEIWVMKVSRVFVSLIFNNHVMQYNTPFHNIMEFALMPTSYWTANYCKTSLKPTKCSLNIFPCTLLALFE
ncbi:unnamed protein product [Cuscuta epithymum]|uniref:Uncharacterized protein n=1 Tax=Cuscuta epithymum TaxID=186058 RepID=A0AAV0D5L5_9ASTE|nr:unnamed protein product [Cuscuta epithymum]